MDIIYTIQYIINIIAIKNGTQSIGTTREGKNTKIHPVATSDRIVLAFLLSAGHCHNAPQGWLLLDDIRLNELAKRGNVFMAMDRGYEDGDTRQLVSARGFIPVVPPRSNRKHSW